MGCYKCGSEEGTQTRLCPECTTARLEERKNSFTVGAQPGMTTPVRSVYPSTVLKGLCIVALVVIGGYYVFYSPAGPGYALSPEQRVLAKCRAKLKPDQMKQKIMKEKFSAGQKGIGADIADAMQGMMAEMMGGFGDAMCLGMAEECKKNPNGRQCQAMLRGM